MHPQEEAMARYLTDSLKMVEQVMKSTPKKQQEIHKTGSQMQSTLIRGPGAKIQVPPVRRAASEVFAPVKTNSAKATSSQLAKPSSDTHNKIYSWKGIDAMQTKTKVINNHTVPTTGGIYKGDLLSRGGELSKATLRATDKFGKNIPPSHVQQTHSKPPLQPQVQKHKPTPRPAPSEAGTNAEWWQPRVKGPSSSNSSVMSYPMTAITDRGGSIANTEFQAWMERINQLENAVKDERSRRQQFQEELKKITSDSMFAVSRGDAMTAQPNKQSGVVFKGR